MTSPEHESRVLVYAPTGRDSLLICNLLTGKGIACISLPNAEMTRNELKTGAGVVVLAEEGLTLPDIGKVAAAYGISSRRLDTEHLKDGPEQDRAIRDALDWLWQDPMTPSLLEVGIPMAANVYPKLAFGRPITEMEPDAKPLDMEGP